MQRELWVVVPNWNNNWNRRIGAQDQDVSSGGRIRLHADNLRIIDGGQFNDYRLKAGRLLRA